MPLQDKPTIDMVEDVNKGIELQEIPTVLATTIIPHLQEEAEWVRALHESEYAKLERKLVRKVDTRLLPPLFILLVLNYLDRNALGASRVQGIEKDLGLAGNQFNVAVSVLYAGYILGQVPSNLLLSRVRPSLYLSAWVALWGVVSGLTALARNYVSLILIRFFLGVVESPYFPGSIFYLSSWYTKQELALRMSIFYTGSLLSGAFSGFISAGIQSGMDGMRGLEAWRWMFIIEGSMTVFFAMIAALVLPDYPSNTRWLTDKEKALAIYRLGHDTGVEDEEKQSLFQAFWTSLKDYKLWLLVLITVTKTTAAGVNQFIPTVVNTFGLSKVLTLVLTAPPYLLATGLTLAVSWSSDRRLERCYHNFIPYAVGMIGFIIAAASKSIAARYFSLFLMIGGMYASYNVTLAWISSTFPRPRSKRAAAFAFVNASGNIANIWSPYFYDKSYGPNYTMAWIINTVMAALAILSTLFLRWDLLRANAKMDKLDEDNRHFETDEQRARRVRYVA